MCPAPNVPFASYALPIRHAHVHIHACTGTRLISPSLLPCAIARCPLLGHSTVAATSPPCQLTCRLRRVRRPFGSALSGARALLRLRFPMVRRAPRWYDVLWYQTRLILTKR